MRRRLVRYLPLVAIALLVQLLAPIGAFRVAAAAANDPLAAAICSGHADDADTAPSGTPQANGNCCAACPAGLAAAPLLEPAPHIFVALQRDHQRVIWLADSAAARLHRAAAHAQPRGPPNSLLT